MLTRHCKRCDQAFEINPSYPHAVWYCSADCYHEHRREQKAEFLQTGKACAKCGQLFYPDPGRSRAEFEARRFCGRECSSHGHRNTIEDVLKRVVVNQKTGCHIWTGTKNWCGYGTVRFDNRWTMVHRTVWEHHRGSIPEGMQVDHMCSVKLCCNVDHLQLLSPRDNCLANTSNSMGAQNSRKTECSICGGPYSFRPNGYRYCKPCWLRGMKEACRRYRARKEKLPQGTVLAPERQKKCCPKCGGSYSIWPNGNRYCKPCRNRSLTAKFLNKKE